MSVAYLPAYAENAQLALALAKMEMAKVLRPALFCLRFNSFRVINQYEFN